MSQEGGLRFVNPIPFVRDIAVSKKFYAELLGVPIEEDHGDFVKFATGFALHDGAALERTVWGAARGPGDGYGRDNVLLYFESDDVDEAFARISPHVEVIHGVVRQAWGQRVFRFYDPDGHAVEIGEPPSPPEPGEG